MCIKVNFSMNLQNFFGLNLSKLSISKLDLVKILEPFLEKRQIPSYFSTAILALIPEQVNFDNFLNLLEKFADLKENPEKLGQVTNLAEMSQEQKNQISTCIKDFIIELIEKYKLREFLISDINLPQPLLKILEDFEKTQKQDT